MSDAQQSLTGKLSGLAGRRFPGLEERTYRRSRDQVIDSLTTAGDYGSRLSDLAMSSGAAARPSLVVIVPMQGPSFETWKPEGGNFFYEVAQSAREYAGADKVSIFEVRAEELPADWHERLIRFLVSSQATHLMGQTECDPTTSADQTWDVLWEQLAPRWDGVFLGVMFDSAFRMITLSARREVGPVNMPISNESLAALYAEIGAVEQIHDVSFIGALYPYRVEMIEALRAHGVDVAVNPHRADTTRDFAESRTNQPTYVDYMRGLAQSKMTINFSVSSSLNGQQLKTRILEASSMGCLVLTDDVDRSDRFWIPGDEVGYFTDPSEVPALVESYLADPERLARAQAAGKARARSINVLSFWGGIDAGLAARGLPQIHD